jgi:hypothetical protein
MGSKTVETVDPCTPLGSTAGAPALIARLLVILSPAHLFLDAGMFDQLAKPLDGIADGLMFAETQPDHSLLLQISKVTIGVRANDAANPTSCHYGPAAADDTTL